MRRQIVLECVSKITSFTQNSPYSADDVLHLASEGHRSFGQHKSNNKNFTYYRLRDEKSIFSDDRRLSYVGIYNANLKKQISTLYFKQKTNGIEPPTSTKITEKPNENCVLLAIGKQRILSPYLNTFATMLPISVTFWAISTPANCKA